MEAYRKKLCRMRNIDWISIAILSVMFIFHQLCEFEVIPLFAALPEESKLTERYISFTRTFLITTLVFTILDIRKVNLALKNEEKLKELYVQTNDERKQHIYTQALSLSARIFIFIGMYAGLILAYFNMTIGITIWVCLIIESLIYHFCYIYYNKKF